MWLLPYSVPEGRLVLLFWMALLSWSRDSAARRQRVGVHVDARGILVRTEHQHLGHAVDLRQLLGDAGLGVFIQLRRERDIVAGDGQVDDAVVGRVHFAQGRRLSAC